MPFIKGIGRLGRAALDLLLPPTCPTCDARVTVQGSLCADCFGQANLISAPFCLRCGVPFGSDQQGGADTLCPVCTEQPPLFQQARAALRYDGHAKRLILPLKHADRTEMAAILAPMMVRAGTQLLARADLLVPVPLHRQRLRERKYNQSALLARSVGRLAGRPVLPDALQRIRRTAPLEDKSPAERAQEVADAVTVASRSMARLKERRILLVDDVMTSGATANACAAALLASGATNVDVLTAARVPDPRLR